jgi:RNA polymerase sigma factor (sigma-70 family)
LKAALDHEENLTPFENLLETLPGATYAEWNRDQLEDLDDLVRRVARRLEKDEGIEVSKLAHEGKLAAGNSDAEDNEPELERFRAREAAARRLSELTRRARLSPRESEILDLRYRKRLGTRQIAEALGIAENTVYVHERNLKKKLREAADL